MTHFVTHLECALCGRRFEASELHNLCSDCQRPLWVRYDLPALRKALSKRDLAERPATLWR